jgi:hypothetical protein
MPRCRFLFKSRGLTVMIDGVLLRLVSSIVITHSPQ